MAAVEPSLWLRHPNIADVGDNQTQNNTTSSSTNTPWNEWSNYQRTGFWMPSFTREESRSYRDSPGKEYMQALRKWQCDYMNYLNYQRWTQMTLPYTLSLMQMQQFYLQQQIQQQNEGSNQQRPRGVRGFNVFNPFAVVGGRPRPQPRNGGIPQARPNVQAAQPNAAIDGRDFLVPALWKRLAAEFIDFFFLFMIKLGIVLLTVDYFGALDLEKYDVELLLSQNIDYEKAFAMTSELIVLEILNRVFNCIFETLCLHKGVDNQIGGATPGKRIMGLRVISCFDVIEIGENRVRVAPARSIGYTNALVRSVIKNFSLAFFLPACFTVFFFQHNRAAYDVIANCMVVELTENDLRMGR